MQPPCLNLLLGPAPYALAPRVAASQRRHATPIYNAIPAACKYYVETNDGSHCAFADDDPTACELLQTISCFGADFIDETYQRNLALALILPWLDTRLKSRPAAFDAFLNELTQQIAAGAVSATGSCY